MSRSDFDLLLRLPYKKRETPKRVSLFFGGLEGDRTLDLTDANRTLSQLSYRPILPLFGCFSEQKADFWSFEFS